MSVVRGYRPGLFLTCVTSQDLKNKKWSKKKWNGPLQYEDPTGKLMMLPTDMVLLWDRGFKK